MRSSCKWKLKSKLKTLAIAIAFFAVGKTQAQTVADPTNFTAFPVSSKRIHLLWTDNATNETNYQVRRGSTNLTPLGANTSSFADLALPAGLTPSTTYNYLLFAFISGGSSSNSVSASATTFPAPPGTPQNFRAVSVTTSQINLAWNATATATYYRVAKKRITPPADAGFSFIPGDITTLSKAVTGLPSNTAYDFNLYAYNTGGASVTPAVLTNISTAAAAPSPSPSPSPAPSPPGGSGPSLVGSLPYVGGLDSSVVDSTRTYAYLASREYCLVVVNISNPAAPFIVGKAQQPCFSGQKKLVLHEGRKLVLSATQIFDVSTPSAPYVKGTIPGDMWTAPAISADGNLVFYGDRGGNFGDTSIIKVANISNAAAPTIANSVNLPANTGAMSDIKISGSTIYFVHNTTLKAYTANTSLSPINSSPAAPQNPNGGPWYLEFVLGNGYAYLFGQLGIYTVNTTNFTLNSTPVPNSGNMRNGSLSGSKLYACGQGGLYIYDLATPSAPTLQKVYDGGFSLPVSMCIDAEGSAGLVYLSSYSYPSGGLNIVDATNVSNPIMRSHIEGGDSSINVEDISVVGNLAAVVTSSRDVKLLDVSVPSAPRLIKVIETFLGNVGGILNGNYLYLMTYASNPAGAPLLPEVRIYDVSNPLAPALLPNKITFSGSTFPISMRISGTSLYVLNTFLTGNSTLSIYSISNPTSFGSPTVVTLPVLLHYNLASGNSWTPFAISGGYVYIPAGPTIQVVNLSNLAITSVTYDAHAIAVSGNKLYSTDGWNLRHFSLANPALPSFLGSTFSHGKAITISGTKVLVGDEGEVHAYDSSANPGYIGTATVGGKTHALTAVGSYVYSGNSLDMINIIAP